MSPLQLFTGGKVVSQQGVLSQDILVRAGGVQQLGAPGAVTDSSAQQVDISGQYVFPGFIDPHVHFREPGLTHKATMLSEARAACYGGVLTVCEMPNTNPATNSLEALQQKVDISKQLPGQDPLLQHFDIRFYFGITEKQHLDVLATLYTSQDPAIMALRQRCSGVKLYLDHSTGNQKVDGGIVESIFRTCSELNIPLVAHCEDAEINQAAAELVQSQGHTSVEWHSLMRPVASEATSIAFALGLARKFGTRFHVAHLSTGEGLEHVRQAKKDLPHVSCEVSPHHLFLTVEDFATLGTLAKMNPPLRTVSERDALWVGVIDGTVDCIATDHAPHTLAEKQTGEPLKAPSGVPGVEVMVPLLASALLGNWSHPQALVPPVLETARSSDEVATLLHRVCFARANSIFGLQKSEVGPGSPAVRLDITAHTRLAAQSLHSPCGWTPYQGWQTSCQIDVIA